MPETTGNIGSGGVLGGIDGNGVTVPEAIVLRLLEHPDTDSDVEVDAPEIAILNICRGYIKTLTGSLKCCIGQDMKVTKSPL